MKINLKVNLKELTEQELIQLLKIFNVERIVTYKDWLKIRNFFEKKFGIEKYDKINF